MRAPGAMRRDGPRAPRRRVMAGTAHPRPRSRATRDPMRIGQSTRVSHRRRRQHGPDAVREHPPDGMNRFGRPVPDQVKTFTARAITRPSSARDTLGLHRHGELGPDRERHRVGRAERGGVGETEVEVVEEAGPPIRAARGRDSAAAGRRSRGTSAGGAPGRPRRRRRAPSRAARRRCCSTPTRSPPDSRAVRPPSSSRWLPSMSAAISSAVDPSALSDEHRDERDRETAQRVRAAVDRAGIAEDQREQQRALERRQQPRRDEPESVPATGS